MSEEKTISEDAANELREIARAMGRRAAREDYAQEQATAAGIAATEWNRRGDK